MSFLSSSKRALVIAGLAGLAATASTTHASAFGLFFGGGPFGGGIQLGGLFGGGPRFDGGSRSTFCRFACSRGDRQDRQVHYARPTSHYHRPVYQAAAPAPVYRAPARVYRALAPVVAPAPVIAPTPVVAPAPVATPAPVAAPQATSVSVVFQPTATTADVTAFMKAYNITTSSGPDANGAYRVQISTDPISQDQLNQIVDSMRSQTNIVTSVGA